MGDYLKGKVAVVTGSGQGIGRAIAKSLAAQGCKVVTNNRKPWDGVIPIDEERWNKISKEMQDWAMTEYAKYYGDAERTAADIIAAGGEAVPCYADMTNYDDAKRLVDTAIENYGHIDIVVNVASSFGFCPVQEMPKSLWDKVITKPTGYFYVIRHAVQHMIDQGWGRIINCASPAWTGGDLRQSEYCSANAGVVGLSYALAAELKEYGITVNAFCPGARTRNSVDMEIYDKMEKKETSMISGELTIKYDQTALPESFSDFIAWLAGDSAKDVTGEVFFVGGKLLARYAIPTLEGMIVADGDSWDLEMVEKKYPDIYKKMPPKPF